MIALWSQIPAQRSEGGEITAAESPNAAGLAVGDPITGFATFESSAVAPVGAFFLLLDASPGGQLSFTVGSFTFTAADDLNYGMGFPLLVFMNAQLVGFEFLALLRACLPPWGCCRRPPWRRKASPFAFSPAP